MVDYPSRAHTRIKHLVYRGYANCWMPKILRSFPSGGAVVDAFSGSGQYSDGLDGSPVIFARSLLGHSAVDSFYPLELVTLDKHKGRTSALQQRLAPLGDPPRLIVSVQEAGAFEESVGRLQVVVAGRPALWIIDPLGWGAIPWAAVSRIAASRGQDLVITLMVNEMYRFLDDPQHADSFTGVFGDKSWAEARQVTGETARKARIVDLYMRRLQSLGCLTRPFDIRIGRGKHRYSLIMASQHKASLDCWNPITWNLDPNSGRGAGEQLELHTGPDLGPLRTLLAAKAGSGPLSWASLADEARDAGYTLAHLRTVLTEMRAEGLAVRSEPIEAATLWPSQCMVQLFAEDPDEETDGPSDSNDV